MTFEIQSWNPLALEVQKELLCILENNFTQQMLKRGKTSPGHVDGKISLGLMDQEKEWSVVCIGEL